MKTLILFILLILSVSVQAKIINIPGIIITGKDTTNVIFRVPVGNHGINYLFIQQKIDFTTENNEEKSLRPTQDGIIYIFEYNSNEIRMLSISNPFPNNGILKRDPYLFFKVEKTGFLKVFRYDYPYEYSSPAQQGNSPVSTFVYQRGNEPLFMPTDYLYFRKKTMEYFNDCPLLVAKIKDRSFRQEHLLQIANFYNQECR